MATPESAPLTACCFPALTAGGLQGSLPDEFPVAVVAGRAGDGSAQNYKNRFYALENFLHFKSLLFYYYSSGTRRTVLYLLI